ncbi:MAG: PAS domain-containing protein [Verrucomicrobia bacterium]|nr:PAS domain-containing protein [Kiritimatiellia bacterium]MCP5489046.1 PAS domain-containing protein [Verrucomicrobiota bacterium]
MKSISIYARVRWIVLATTLCSLLAANVCGLMVVHRLWHENREQHIRATIESMVQILGQRWDNPEEPLQHLSVLSAHADMRYALILDGQGEAMATWGEPLARLEPTEGGGRTSLSIRDYGTYWEVWCPILQQGDEVGTLQVQIDQVRDQRRFREIILASLGVISLGLILAAALSPLAVRPMIKPLKNMTDFVARVKAGEQTNERISYAREDEMGALAAGINGMLDRISLASNRMIDQLAFLQDLVNSMPLPIYCKSTSGSYLLVNRRFAELVVRRPVEAIIGRTLAEVRPDLASGVLRELERMDQVLIESAEGPQILEERIADVDGNEREVRVTKSVFRNARSEVAGLIGIIEELTEERAIERAAVESIVVEQQRISRDLHNDLSQVITAAAYKLKLIELQAGQDMSGGMVDGLKEALALVNQAAAKTRSIARELTPVELEGDGLSDALQVLVRSIEKGRSLRCTYQGEDPISPLPGAMANQVYALVLQMMQLATRFRAVTRIDLQVEDRPDLLSLHVSFDGLLDPGSEAEQIIWEKGLEILRYRARLISGKIIYAKNRECANSLSCMIQRKGLERGAAKS